MKILSLIRVLAYFAIVVVPWVFVPSSQKAYAATSPGLGNATTFAVLAGSGITNVPTSVITGDVGLSPAAGSNIVGLSPSEVSGTIWAVDSTGPEGSAGSDAAFVNSAKTDWTTAYNGLFAGGNAACTTDYGAVVKDLSGESLAPGVYCAEGAGRFTLTGTLTLTGTGVWIFRSGSSLITSGTANVVGGQPCDVWWAVPSSATLGTTTSLIGNVMASTSISMSTGATLNGRAQASTGAVTMQSNTINNSCTSARALSVDLGGSGSIYNGVASCPVLNSVIPPVIIESRRIDADSVFISWGPYSGVNTFVVQYGLSNGNWLYSTNVTGFSTTINDLPLNQPIWVRVAATNGCGIGVYGEAALAGGPLLPNTGMSTGTHERSVPWFMLLGIFLSSRYIYLAQTREMFPFKRK